MGKLEFANGFSYLSRFSQDSWFERQQLRELGRFETSPNLRILETRSGLSRGSRHLSSSVVFFFFLTSWALPLVYSSALHGCLLSYKVAAPSPA